MKLRKALAILLAVATVFTSQAFTSVVYAAEDPGSTVQSEETEVSETEEEATEDEEQPSEEENDNQTSDEQQDDSQSEDQQQNQNEDQTIGDDAENTEDSEEEIIDEEEIVDPELEEELLEEELEEDEASLESADDYFVRDNVVDDKNTLKRNSKPLASTVTIPKEVQVIPVGIFDGNSTVKEVKFESDSKLEKIEEGAFRNSSVKIIELPVSYTGAIPKNTFRNSKLESITFNGAITSIGESAFAGTNLKSITANSCTKVEESAFQGCQYLTTVKMTGLETIGESAFSGCTSLNGGFDFKENISITKIGINAFRNCGFTSLNLTKVTGVGADGTIGAGAFSGNTKLSSVKLDENNTGRYLTIPASMFAECTALSDVNSLPSSLTTICGSAFEGCTSLSKIIIPSLVKNIESEAFGGCSKLSTIDICYKPVSDDVADHISIAYDAFPLKSGVKMRGYDTYVRDYAQMMGYTFESMNEEHEIKPTYSGTKVILSKYKARVGDKVTVAIEAADEYSFTGIDVYYSSGSEEVHLDASLDEFTSKGFLYSFEMPDYKVNVMVKGESNTSLAKKPLTYDFVGVDPYTPFEYNKNNDYTFKKRGLSAKLKLSVDGVQYDNSLFKFSSNSSNIMVDNYGVITGVAEGMATITVTPRYASSKKFNIYMHVAKDGNVDIAKMAIKKMTAANPDCVIDQGNDPITGYPYITFDKKSLQSTTQQVNVDINAYAWNEGKTAADTGKSYYVKSAWSTTDSSIAKVASASRTTNNNTITIQKGATGEALISVSTVNVGETGGPNWYNEKYSLTYPEENIAYLMIRVIDTTPRLGETSLTVNNQLKAGAPMTIVPVYGYEINDDVGLKVCYKTTTNGVTSYSSECGDLEAEYVSTGVDKGWRLKTTLLLNNSLDINKTKEYKKNTLYLVGQYKAAEGHRNNGYFYIPLPAIMITNTRPAPTLSQSGKINMFYNNTASKDEVGEIILTQSLKNLTVEKYEFVSATNYKNPGIERPENALKDNVDNFDSLGYNFDITIDADNRNKAKITRSSQHTDVAKVSKKTVVSGYLYIYYEEYKEPAKVAITVSNTDTAPTYYLSQTSVTANANAKGQKYQLYLYPKGKSNLYVNAVDLTNTIDATTGEKNVIFNGSTTGNFLEEKMQEVENKQLKDKYRINLELNDGATVRAGKTVIGVHMTTWSDPDKKLYYTFTVATTTKDSTVSMDKSAVTVNRAYVNADAEKNSQTIKFKPSTTDMTIVGLYNAAKDGATGVYYKPGTNAINAKYEKVKGLLTVGTDSITIRQPKTAEELDFTGSFSFIVYPEVQYKGTTENKRLAAKSFTVNIVNNVPKLTVAKTFTFNTTLEDEKEKPSSSYTLSNLLTGTKMSEYKVSLDNAKLLKKATGAKEVTYSDFADKVAGFSISLNEEKNTGAIAAAKKGFKKEDAGTYTVTGATITSADGSKATLAAFTVILAANAEEPKVAMSAPTGQINTIDKYSYLTYTPIFKNISDVTVIEGPTLLELDSTGDRAVSEANKHFICKYDSVNNKVYVQLKDDKEIIKTIVPGKTYKIKLKFGVKEMTGKAGSDQNLNDGDIVSDILSIVPVETYPTLSATPKRSYVYAGQNRNNDTMWYVEVPVKLPQQYITTETTTKTEIFEPGDEPGEYKNTPKSSVVTTTKKTGQTATAGTTITTSYDAKNVKTVVTKTVKCYVNMKITDFDWGSSASNAVKNMFEIGQVKDGTFYKNDFTKNPMIEEGEDIGLITIAIKLKDASQVVQNKQYALNLVAHYANQTIDSETSKVRGGSNFTIKLDVKK